MSDEMRELVMEESQDKMRKAISHLQGEFGGVRTGRASSALVEKLKVDVYGSEVPLQQIAGFGVPEPRVLTISPYDKSSIKAIEKVVRTQAEEARVAVRNIRRQTRHELEGFEKDGELSKDDLDRAEKELEKRTHDVIGEIDDLLKHKETELLQI